MLPGATERPGFGALKEARRSSADAQASLNNRLLDGTGLSFSRQERKVGESLLFSQCFCGPSIAILHFEVFITFR